MLEFNTHQGTSLCGAMNQDGLRVVTVAGTSGGAERPLVWAICAHLQRLGYPSLVLDGWGDESEAAPGLVDLLEQRCWIDATLDTDEEDAASLGVLPAARGLAELVNAADQEGSALALQTLYPLFRRYAVLVIYAPTETLASALFEGSHATPLIVMSCDERAAVVNAYAQLKLLALHADIGGLVACPLSARCNAALVRLQLDKLFTCAQAHLGRVPASSALDVSRPAEVQRLALALLERALQLTSLEVQPAIPWRHSARPVAALATSH